MLAFGSQSDLPGPAANTDKDRGPVCGCYREPEPAGRKADARDSALHGFRIGGYCFPCFYHAERNHQGLDNKLVDPGEEIGRTTGDVACRQRLGGILQYYYRAA